MRCKGCGETFLVKDADDVPVLEEASPEDLRRHAGSRARSASPPRRRRDEDEDDRGFDEEEEPSQGSGLLIILGVCGAILLLLGVGGGLAWYFAARTVPSSTQASNSSLPPDQGTTNPPNGTVSNPGGNNPAPPPRTETAPPRDVTTALARLKDGDRSAKAAALRFLKTAPLEEGRTTEVAKALENVLDTEVSLASEALPALRRWAPATAIERLAKRLQDPTAGVIDSALDELSQIDDDRAAELLGGEFKVANHRGMVARYLPRLGKRAEKYILPYYNDQDIFVRGDARRIIQTIRTSDEDILKQSVADLEGTNKDRRNNALEVVAKFEPKDKQTRERVSLALNPALADKDFFTTGKVLATLKKWATTENVPALCDLLSDAGNRKQVVELLAGLEDDRMIKPLVLAMNTPERPAIAKILIGYGKKVEPDVQALLNLRIPATVRATAAFILGEVGTTSSVNLLKRYIQAVRLDKAEVAIGREALAKVLAREKAKMDREKDKGK